MCPKPRFLNHKVPPKGAQERPGPPSHNTAHGPLHNPQQTLSKAKSARGGTHNKQRTIPACRNSPITHQVLSAIPQSEIPLRQTQRGERSRATVRLCSPPRLRPELRPRGACRRATRYSQLSSNVLRADVLTYSPRPRGSARLTWDHQGSPRDHPGSPDRDAEKRTWDHLGSRRIS